MDDKLKVLIDSHVKGTDLYQVSPKDIRLEVEKALGKSYEKKEFLDMVIKRALQAREEEKIKESKKKRKKKSEPSISTVDKKKPKKPVLKVYTKAKINKLDDKLVGITGYKYLPYVVLMKLAWKYVKDKNLQQGTMCIPDENITIAFDQTEPFSLLNVLAKKAKGLMEDVKRDDIPSDEMKKTMRLLQELDVENEIEHKKKMEKYQVAISKYEESNPSAVSPLDALEVKSVHSNEKLTKFNNAMLISSSSSDSG